MGLFGSKSGHRKPGKEETKKETAAAKPEPEKAAKPAPVVNEEDLLFDKSYTCPVCDMHFRSKTIKTGKVQLLSQDTDLRPRYKYVDCIKYDVIACPGCGYSSLSRFFDRIMPTQAKMIMENITKNFRGLPETGGIYTYGDAITRYNLAISNTLVKKAKASEKAYTYLKTAWLYRGKAESLNKEEMGYEKALAALQKDENELMLKAYEGFSEAFTKEDFPMCGMDELTVTYLVAELARQAGDYEESKRWISRVLTSRNASERIKEKARHIKELIDESMGNEEEAG